MQCEPSNNRRIYKTMLKVTQAKRPFNSQMSNRKYLEKCGLKVPDLGRWIKSVI